MSESFKTAKEFARHWQGGKSLEEMTEGAEKRQDKMIGMIIDAAIVTSLYRALCWGASAESLRTLFHVVKIDGVDMLLRQDGTPYAPFDKVKRHIKEIQEQYTGAQRADQIYNYISQDLINSKVIVNHRNLVEDGDWNSYSAARTNYFDLKAFYEQEVREGHPVDERMRPVRPADPRIEACNERIGHWLLIKDSGAKSLESIQSKVSRKRKREGRNYNPSVDIRDVNRLMILPDVPETADAFYRILSHQIGVRVKSLGADQKPHLFVENWSVKPWGQFDRMAYMALHADAPDGGLDADNVAVAEIKVVGKQMERADALTAPLYALHRELDDNRTYFPDSARTRDEKNYLQERDKLRQLYRRCKIAFESAGNRIYGQGKCPYVFPDISPDLNRPEHYETLRHGLNVLSQQIYIDALNSEQGILEWAPTFLFTAYYQQAISEWKKEGLGSKAKVNSSGVSADRIEEGLLKRVGGEKFAGHAELRLKAYAQFRADMKSKGSSKERA